MIEYLMPFLVEHRTVILLAVLGLANEALEYWLGRTDKVKAVSKLEMVVLLIKKIKSVFKS